MKTLSRQDWAARAIARMKAQKITQDILCRALGVTPAAVSHYLTGRRDPNLAQLAIIAKTLNMPSAELVYGIGHQSRGIPILEWTQVTNWKKDGSDLSHETIPYFYTENREIYALRINDDSMFSPLNPIQSFRENTLIIVDPTQTPKENQFVIAVCHQTKEVLFRQYVKTQGKYYLKPINQQYPMIESDKKTQLKGMIISQMNICT